MPITFGALRRALDAVGGSYRILALNDTDKLLLWEDRGRIYGPFTGDDSAGVAWAPRCFADPEELRSFLADGNWNVGGDRLWIAPEFPFFTKERARFNETYTVQADLDPGHYRFGEGEDGGLTMTSDLRAELYEHEFREKTFRISRAVAPCANPLRAASARDALMEGVRYCGFTQTVSLTDTSPDAPMPLEIWNLFQVRAGGVFLLPYFGGTFDYVDYYTPSEGRVLDVRKGYAVIRVDSCAEHKVGAKAYHTCGRIGYLLREEDGWSLLVRNYANNPSDPCIKEPSDQPGQTGCSLFVYMNDTRGDGFAELESTGETFQAPGRPSSVFSMNYWFFRGSLERLKPIISVLLNIEYEEDPS